MELGEILGLVLMGILMFYFISMIISEWIDYYAEIKRYNNKKKIDRAIEYIREEQYNQSIEYNSIGLLDTVVISVEELIRRLYE